MSTIEDVLKIIDTVKPFLSKVQLQIMADCCRGQEGEFYKAKFIEVATTIRDMPATYDQESLGEQAVVHLHYFGPGCDYYITEKDMEGDGTLQAFGLYPDQGGLQFDYVSIAELVENNLELDLYWEKITVAQLRLDGDSDPEPV